VGGLFYFGGLMKKKINKYICCLILVLIFTSDKIVNAIDNWPQPDSRYATWAMFEETEPGKYFRTADPNWLSYGNSDNFTVGTDWNVNILNDGHDCGEGKIAKYDKSGTGSCNQGTAGCYPVPMFSSIVASNQHRYFHTYSYPIGHQYENITLYTKYTRTCIDYDATIVDSDGDGVVDSQDSEPYNPNVSTIKICTGELTTNCHAGLDIDNTRDISDFENVKIEKLVYDANGEIVYAEFQVQLEDGTWVELAYGNHDLALNIQNGQIGGTITQPENLIVSGTLANNLLGQDINNNPQTPLQPVPTTSTTNPTIGDTSTDPGSETTTDLIDYTNQFSTMIENQGVEHQIGKSQLDIITDLLNETRQTNNLLRAGSGDGDGDGDGEGVPWGSAEVGEFLDGETEGDGGAEGTLHGQDSVPDDSEVNEELEVPTEYQTKDETWKDTIRGYVENNPVTDILDGIDISVSGSPEVNLNLFGESVTFSASGLDGALNAFGVLLIAMSTFAGIMMVVKRN
jgi:hypothetical protein